MKIFSKFLGLLLFLFTLAAAQENVVISPQSIVVNPLPSPNFQVRVTVDKDPTGEATPSYQIGENIIISVTPTQDAYIYLFSVHSDGVITQILPNQLDEQGRNNLVQANQTKTFPPQGARYTFTVQGPEGLDKVLAVASREPLDTSQLVQFRQGEQFATSTATEESFAQTLSIVVTPIAEKDPGGWVTDTALFYVGAVPTVPQFGTIVVRSAPAGARAFIDGQFIGLTPVSFGTVPGAHTVRVELEDHETFETTVELAGGQTLEVDATLVQMVRMGSLNVGTNVANAEVYINGQLVGNTDARGEFVAQDLPAGAHNVSVRAAGYANAEQAFDIVAGQVARIEPILRRHVGAVTFSSNVPGAEVFVGNISFGTTPTEVSHLAAGQYEAIFRRAGFADTAVGFSVAPGSSQQVEGSLTPQ